MVDPSKCKKRNEKIQTGNKKLHTWDFTTTAGISPYRLIKVSVLCYRRDLEEHSEELIRIKECYVQLGEDSRGLEQKLREEFEKEKQMLLSEVTSTAWEPVFFYPERIVTNISQGRGPIRGGFISYPINFSCKN